MIAYVWSGAIVLKFFFSVWFLLNSMPVIIYEVILDLKISHFCSIWGTALDQKNSLFDRIDGARPVCRVIAFSISVRFWFIVICFSSIECYHNYNAWKTILNGKTAFSIRLAIVYMEIGVFLIIFLFMFRFYVVYCLCVSGQCLHLLHCDSWEQYRQQKSLGHSVTSIKDATWKGRVYPIKHEDSGLYPFKKFPAHAYSHRNKKL